MTTGTMEMVTAQVAHDIRSPLTALRVLVGHLGEVAEDKRVMIRNAVQRIEDIANDLAGRKHNTDVTDDDATETSTQLLSSLLEPLISEKRIQYRARLGIMIESTLDADTYGTFVAVQPCEFKRVVSNLVNNAVEALQGPGVVTVGVERVDTQVQIRITDTGRGIPPDILAQLTQRGATFGKAGGSGLGLYHARTTVESWGGTLALTSEVGHGTTVTLTLPRAAAPAWFVPELQISHGTTIVVIDDDASIHQVWEERLATLEATAHAVTLHHFASGTAIVAWYQQQPPTRMLFLCDYELLGEPNNGLDLIEQLGIQHHAILVTSHYEETLIQERCADLGVRLIPKGLAGFVPIRVENTTADSAKFVATATTTAITATSEADNKPTALVLDDDDGIRCVWPMEGRRLGLGSVTTFASMEACEAAAPNYAQFDFAFVDKNIPDSAWRLDQVIAHLKACGVKKVLVASGESARALESDPQCTQADGIIPMKIPQQLPL